MRFFTSGYRLSGVVEIRVFNDWFLSVLNVAVFIDIALAVNLLEGYELGVRFHLLCGNGERHFLDTL